MCGSNFYESDVNKTSLANIWMNFSSNNLALKSEQNLSFSVTTISSTTYSTTTTITATMPFNICPDCPENDTMIEVPSMFF